MFSLADKMSADEKSLLSMPNHLRAANASKRTQSREKIDCLQDVGFSLGVVPEKEMKPGLKINIQPPIIAEFPKP